MSTYIETAKIEIVRADDYFKHDYFLLSFSHRKNEFCRMNENQAERFLDDCQLKALRDNICDLIVIDSYDEADLYEDLAALESMLLFFKSKDRLYV